MQRSSPPLSLFLIGFALGAPACQSDDAADDLGDSTSETSQQIASHEGKLEIALDAPWRIEPRAFIGTPPPGDCFVNCNPTYPEIPIQLTIHDADQYADDAYDDPLALAGALGEVIEVVVTERHVNAVHTRTFAFDHLHEVEYLADAWPRPNDDGSYPAFTPDQRLCRRWQGTPCTADFRRIGDKNEWHATAMYRPQTQVPGATVELDVTLRVSRLDRYGRVTGSRFELTNHLRVHLGEAPLPRFDDRWIYGDLHYHSQGTDNDGESAYAYRGVLQAMAAMGLDFVLAADHASDSAQVTDIDLIDFNTWPPVSRRKDALRDMNAQRFAHLNRWIHDPTGANQQALSFRWQDWGLTRAPQILLGGEVDVVPEMDVDAQLESDLRYGNGLHFDYQAACTALPGFIKWIPGAYGCISAVRGTTPALYLDEPAVRALLSEEREPGRFVVKDVQGWGVAPARQHMLYLPSRPDPLGFVSSKTSEFGGATRRLSEILRDDFDGKDRGFTFLAHPISGSTGSDTGRLGPDLVPYTDVQLETAFASPHVRGLQLWNEDDRVSTPIGEGDAHEIDWSEVRAHGTAELMPWWQDWRWGWKNQSSPATTLHHGAAQWDKMLLWGLDPRRTAALPWLATGQPRRVFMAGGSDAHGDLNYRRHGEVEGSNKIGDTAIGKPRNLVFVGAGAAGHAQIATGLAEGRFSVTDGPALRIGIDLDGNGRIDDTDTGMGGVRELAKGARVPIVVEWKTTAEFGKVAAIDLYVGVFSNALGEGMVYAPFQQGVRGIDDPATGKIEVTPGNWSRTHTHAATGRAYYQTDDHYWGDATGTLRRYNPAHTYDAIARMSFSIDPAQFPVLGFDCNDLINRVELADRLFIRAFARTDGNPPPARACDLSREECISRWAFTSPVWVTTPAAAPIVQPVGPARTSIPASWRDLTAPAFEPTSAAESVRIDRRQGRLFDRGYNSSCASGVGVIDGVYRDANDWNRGKHSIAQRRSWLGWGPHATVPVSPNPGWLVDGGAYQHFSLGTSLYFNPHVWPSASSGWGCTYSIGFGIREAWFNSGYEGGVLGYPITDERAYGGGAYQYFDKGAVFWKGNLGSITLRGELAVRHLELMRQGFAAFPTGSWGLGTNPGGQVAHFENGASIYWSPTTGARLVEGSINTQYQALGGPFSWLGYPTGEAAVGPDGWRYQTFTGGTLFERPGQGTGACVQSGTTRWPLDLPDRPAEY